MKLSQRLQEERAYVESTLGDSIICERCLTDLLGYGEYSTADLAEACPGFNRIENAKVEFSAKGGK